MGVFCVALSSLSVGLSGISLCVWDILDSNFWVMTGSSDKFLAFLLHCSLRHMME